MDGWKFGWLDGSVGGYMDGKLEILLVGKIEVVQDSFTVYEMELAQAKLRDSFYPSLYEQGVRRSKSRRRS